MFFTFSGIILLIYLSSTVDARRCRTSTTTTTTTTTTPAPTPCENCTCAYEGEKIPWYMFTYLQCINHTWILQGCPYGYNLNGINGTCEPFLTTTTTTTSPVPTTSTAPTTTVGTTINPNSPLGEGYPCAYNGETEPWIMFMYLQCMNHIWVSYACPVGFNLNGINGTCQQDPYFTTTTTSTTIPVPTTTTTSSTP